MKKYFLVFLCAVLVLTGCGKKNEVTCSKTVTEDGQTITMSVVAHLDDNQKITTADLVYDFADKTYADSFCSLAKLGGDTSKVTCDGSKITIKDMDNMSSDDEDDDSEKVAGKTKDDFVKEAKEAGYSCK